MMKKIVILLVAIATTLTACGDKKNSKKAANEDDLWTMLNGYWKYIDTTADPDELQNVFYFFGYDDDNKPFSNVIWGYEGSEREYVTKVTKLGEHKFSVLSEVLENREEEGLYEIHDAYTIVQDYDLSNYSNKRITITSSEGTSEWEYVGTAMPPV